jgi:thioredoxin-related protein
MGSANVRVSRVAADELKWEGYGDALAEAKQSGKKVLVDVYTNWCGWCKKMDKNVYGDSKIIDYLREHYISVKLNAESAATHEVKGKKLSEKEIARSYGIRSFPTTVFLTPGGEAITAVPGYIDAPRFLLVLRYINEEHYKDTKWDEFVAENS